MDHSEGGSSRCGEPAIFPRCTLCHWDRGPTPGGSGNTKSPGICLVLRRHGLRRHAAAVRRHSTIRYGQIEFACGYKGFGPEGWTAVLTCNETRGRLAACRIEPDSTATGEAAEHALALTRRLHLRSTPAIRNKRATILLSITYSAGECGWQCVPTPAPPRLPG